MGAKAWHRGNIPASHTSVPGLILSPDCCKNLHPPPNKNNRAPRSYQSKICSVPAQSEKETKKCPKVPSYGSPTIQKSECPQSESKA